jgi:gamma-glutamyltranspeptidase/glutathione hydrolase
MKGAIAAGDAETAAAAAEMLADGGNAFDAALAALCVAPVSEPVLASLAGGGFLLAHPADGEPLLYDFFCQTPRTKRPASELEFFPVDADFGTTRQEFHIGLGAVATPGVVAGLFEAHGDLGRLPMTRIVEPAIRLAREGMPVSPLQARILGIVEPIYLATDTASALFGSARAPAGALREGEIYRPLAMADALEALAREGRDLFYRGEIAAQLAGVCADGGALDMADLENYEVVRRRPLGRDWRGARIYTNPPPSAGGPLIVFALAMLAQGMLPAAGPQAPEWLRTLADAMATTNEARAACGLDEACDDARVAALLSEPLLAEYRTAMAGRALKQGGTTHISVIDAEGNAAALSLSNGEGCGHVLPCGIMPNNMLGEEDINPKGFHEWMPNARISSMMAPTVVREGRGSLMALGSGGSNRIRTAILQVLVNALGFGMGLREAVEAPRIHFERELLNVEAVGAPGGFDKRVIASFAEPFGRKELWDGFSMFYGGVHAVSLDRDSGNFDGAGDPRRGGVYVEV